LTDRQRALVKARARFNAALPRQGRVQRQARRCLLARQGVASLRELREWCYPSQDRRHWHQTNIYRALAKLGAARCVPPRRARLLPVNRFSGATMKGAMKDVRGQRKSQRHDRDAVRQCKQCGKWFRVKKHSGELCRRCEAHERHTPRAT